MTELSMNHEARGQSTAAAPPVDAVSGGVPVKGWPRPVYASSDRLPLRSMTTPSVPALAPTLSTATTPTPHLNSDADRPLRRATAHRPPALKLPDDPRDAAAQALAFINGADSYNRAAAIEGLNQRIAVLSDGDSDAALSELAAHLPILQSLFLKYSAEATTASRPEHKNSLLRMALSAQNSYTRTVIAISGLRQQRAGRGRINVIDDDKDDL